jgi:uncharacterized caspase-like protein
VLEVINLNHPKMSKYVLILSLFLSLKTYCQKDARLVLPVGHFFGVDMIDISSNEKYLVTHDINNNIVLWEVGSNKEILRIESSSKVSSVLFKGETIIAYFVKDSLYEYDIRDGESVGYKTDLEVKIAKYHKNSIYTITKDDRLHILEHTDRNGYRKTYVEKSIADISCNSKYVYAVTYNGNIIELEGAKQINKYSLKGNLEIRKIAKQRTGDIFCLASESGNVFLYNTRTNTYKEIYKFNEAITGIVFSKDDKRVYTCSNDFSTLSHEIATDSQQYVMLNDYCTGLLTLNNGSIIVGCYDGNVFHFNKDLKRIGAFTSALEKPTIFRYISNNVVLLGKDNGSVLQIDIRNNRKFQTNIASARISDIIKSSRTDETIISSNDGSLYRYNYISKNKLLIASFPTFVINIEFSPASHKYLVLLSNAVYLFDTAFNVLDSTISRVSWFVNTTDEYFTTGGSGEFIYVNNYTNKITRVELPNALKSELVAEVHYSKQDSVFYIGTYGGKILTYKKSRFEVITDFDESLHHLYFNSRENSLYAVIKSNKVQKISLKKKPVIRTVFQDSTLNPDDTWNIDFDKDKSRYLVASGRRIHIFDSLWNYTQPPIIFSDLVCVAPDSRLSAQFSPDSKGIMSMCYDGSYHWNPFRNNKYEIDTIPYLQIEQIGNNLKIKPTGVEYNNYRYEITTPYNRKLKYLQLDNDDWLVYDTDFHFDGTENARKLLYFTCGTEVIALDQLKDQLWVPNLAERIAAGDSIRSKSIKQLNICGLTPEITETNSSDSTYQFLINPRRGGIGKIDLIVNGIEVNRYELNQLNQKGSGFELNISRNELSKYFVGDKTNTVSIKAYTSDNAIFARGLKIEESQVNESTTAPPNLYAVMVGVSDYKGTELDLKYADKDAQDLSVALQAASRKLLNADGNEHVFIYNLNTSPNRSRLPEKNSIRITLEEIGKKAKPNDILLIFFAGHGVMEEVNKQFYFLTADASPITSTSTVEEVGISTFELTEWIKPQNIRAQKRILIFDACNSGQAIKDLIKIGSAEQGYLAARNDEQSQLIKAIDKLNERSGLFILSASASNQPAYEMGRYSQGLLTYALLKAVKQQPDILDQGSYLDLSRWFLAAERTVTELTRENGARQQPQIVSNTNFNIGIVDEVVRETIKLPQEKPIFLSSSFQNADERIGYDDLELGNSIDRQLQELASRGVNSQITYLTGPRISNAWSLTGRYEIIDKTLKVKVNMRIGSNPPKHKFEITGNLENLKELINKISDNAIAMVVEEDKGH